VDLLALVVQAGPLAPVGLPDPAVLVVLADLVGLVGQAELVDQAV
jgi:hypothetical protein